MVLAADGTSLQTTCNVSYTPRLTSVWYRRSNLFRNSLSGAVQAATTALHAAAAAKLAAAARMLVREIDPQVGLRCACTPEQSSSM